MSGDPGTRLRGAIRFVDLAGYRDVAFNSGRPGERRVIDGDDTLYDPTLGRLRHAATQGQRRNQQPDREDSTHHLNQYRLKLVPTTVTSAPPRADSPEPRRKLWTRAECDAFEATGLWEQQKLELIEGELIDKMGKNRPHVNVQSVVQAWLIQIFGGAFVNTETPIDVAAQDNPTNEPEPDIIVLAKSGWEITGGNAQPHELALVVEVADSSLRFDLETKARLFARANIREYWVFDVNGRRLIVHRNPRSGKYTDVAAYEPHEFVAPLAAPGHHFRVASAFGPE